MNYEQYQIVAARRQTYDTMLWQTPVLSLTAQAFLFTVALSAQNTPAARLISAMLALIAALASLQLLAKHRFNEVNDSKLLEAFEGANSAQGYEVIHVPTSSPKWYQRLSSYSVWVFALGAFAVGAILVLVDVLILHRWLK